MRFAKRIYKKGAPRPRFPLNCWLCKQGELSAQSLPSKALRLEGKT